MKTQETRTKYIRTIWGISKELQIHEEYLHVLVYALTGKESIASLSLCELKNVVKHLFNEKEKRNRELKIAEKEKNVYRLPTPLQRYTLNKAMLEVREILNLRDTEAYLNSMTQRMYNKDLNRLDRGEFGNLIKQILLITRRKNANNPTK